MKPKQITDYFVNLKNKQSSNVLEAKQNKVEAIGNQVNEITCQSENGNQLHFNQNSQLSLRNRSQNSSQNQIQHKVLNRSQNNSQNNSQNAAQIQYEVQNEICSEIQNNLNASSKSNSQISRPNRSQNSVIIRSQNSSKQSVQNEFQQTNQNNVELMRKVFQQAQYIQQFQSCIQILHKFLVDFHFEVFYEEFCRDLQCALQYEHNNPAVQNILNTIASFLLSVKQKYSINNLKRKLSNCEIEQQKFKKSKKKSSSFENDEQIENLENVPTDEIIVMLNKSRGSKKKKDNHKSASSIQKSSTKHQSSEQDQLEIIYKTFRNLLDFTLSDVLIPFLDSINVNTRLNTFFILRKLINSIEDLDVNLFIRLKDKILERLIDKSPKIRSSAAFLLYRFQGDQLQSKQNDAVQDGLIFHLKYDSSPEVRLMCLNVILINKDTLPAILTKTREIIHGLRQKTYIKLAGKLDFKKQLNKEERLNLIRNGLTDRTPAVQSVFINQVIPCWIKCYNDDLIDLLKDLNENSNFIEFYDDDAKIGHRQMNKSKLIEQFLTNYFESTFSINQTDLSKFHLILINFCKLYLNEQFLIKREHFNTETFFLWTQITKFLKKKEDEENFSDAKIRIKLKKQFNQLMSQSLNTRLNNPFTEIQLISNSSEQVIEQRSDQMINLQTNRMDRLDNLNDELDENNNQTVNIPIIVESTKSQEQRNQTTSLDNLIDREKEEDLDYSILDLIMPKFSEFIDFFRSFCEQQLLRAYHEEDKLIQYEFMFEQLVDFLGSYEIADDSQKISILNLVEELFEIGSTVNSELCPEVLMNYVFEKVYHKNKKLFFNYSLQLLKNLEFRIELEETKRDNEKINEKDIRDLEIMNANRLLTMHELRDQLDEAVSKFQYDIAHQLQCQIDLNKQESNKLIKEIERMKNVLDYQENKKKCEDSPHRGVGEQSYDIINYPIEHLKLLQIFEFALKWDLDNRLMDFGFDRYILSGILSIDRQLRFASIKALNQACLLNSTRATRFCPLYFQICLNDDPKLQNCALQGLIDQIVEHGPEILYACSNESTDKVNQESNNDLNKNHDEVIVKINVIHEQATAKRASLLSPFLTVEESQQNVSSLELANEVLVNKSQFIKFDASSSTHLNTSLQVKKQIIKGFIRFLLKYTKSSDEKLKSTSVMGISKLMLLGRIYSPKLLCELILLWYKSNTSQSIQQDIGTFLPIYCLELSSLTNNLVVQLPSHLTGQQSLLECFMVTVENIYDLERGQQLNSSFDVAHSNYYDTSIDVLNVIDFMLNLLEPINHAEIAVQVCEKILEILKIEREDEYLLREPFITKYLIRSLNSFKLVELTAEHKDELDNLLRNIQNEDRYQELKKCFISRIQKFQLKLF